MDRNIVETRSIVSAQVTMTDRERLEQLARDHDRTLSAEVRRAIREHINREAEQAATR